MPRSLLLLLTLPLASTLRLGSAPKMCSSESSANVPAVIIGGQIGPLLQGKIAQRKVEKAIAILFGIIGLSMGWIVLKTLI